MYYCLTCRRDFSCLEFQLDEHWMKACTTKGCTGAIFSLDDMIAEAVVMLNDKGYATDDSCSGHFNNVEDQIAFYVGFAPGKLPPLDGLERPFVAFPDNAISVGFPEFPPDAPRTELLMEINQRFLAWVRQLPAVPGRDRLPPYHCPRGLLECDDPACYELKGDRRA